LGELHYYPQVVPGWENDAALAIFHPVDRPRHHCGGLAYFGSAHKREMRTENNSFNTSGKQTTSRQLWTLSR
jgi:hypothetical protein